MDTQGLVVTVDEEGGVPAWVAEPARMGARIALELLRSPQLPDQILVVHSRQAKQVLDLFETADEDAVSVSDTHTIAIAYDAVTSATYIGYSNPPREVIARAIAFCAGFESARYALERLAERGADVPFVGEADDPLYATASAVASAASEFVLLAGDLEGDSRSIAVGFFLNRLATIVVQEGNAAIWRGAIGRAVRGLIREVRFSETPGKVITFGERLRDPTDVLRLVEFAGGRAPWPFAMRSR